MTLFLTVDQIIQIHKRVIDLYGGSHGLRDENLLRSALDRAENYEYYVPAVTIPGMAAVLGWGLIKNHVFLDGNKRIGLAAILTFLEGNQYRLNCTEQESQGMVLRAAASEIDEAAWTAWLERVAIPR